MDTLRFYAFSADKPAGDGAGEQVTDKTKYAALNAIPNWRRMFSSMWDEDPFVVRGRTYKSYDHAFQAMKYETCGYPMAAYRYSLDSGEALSLNPVRRSYHPVVLTSAQLAHWEENLPNIKNELYRAKYTRESRPGRALMATGMAELVNAGPRIKTIRCERLESIRRELAA